MLIKYNLKKSSRFFSKKQLVLNFNTLKGCFTFCYSAKSKLKFKNKILLIISGCVIGLLNGFFGGGGGMVCVPILEKVLSLPNKHAHATAIAVIFPISYISAIIYVLNGYVKSFPLIIVGLGVLLGGILGSFCLKWLPPKAVRIIFALIMLAGGIRMII